MQLTIQMIIWYLKQILQWQSLYHYKRHQRLGQPRAIKWKPSLALNYDVLCLKGETKQREAVVGRREWRLPREKQRSIRLVPIERQKSSQTSLHLKKQTA